MIIEDIDCKQIVVTTAVTSTILIKKCMKNSVCF